jgi:RimJ/RimL family protein N-acetyltransferase
MGNPTASPWQRPAPRLSSGSVELREIDVTDAEGLFPIVTAEAVRRFYSPPPKTPAEFRRFIDWTRQRHTQGDHVCFTVGTKSGGAPCGLFQLRRREGGFHVAEWGFCLTPSLWSTGIFVECATLVLDYAFDTLQLHRLEARVVVENVRATGALAKLGAVPEGILRQSFFSDGRYQDETLWAVLRQDWMRRRESLLAGRLAERGPHSSPERWVTAFRDLRFKMELPDDQDSSSTDVVVH